MGVVACSPACVARAYRARRRARLADFRQRGLIKAMAITGPPPPYRNREAYERWCSYDEATRDLASSIMGRAVCPVCGAVVWAGVRRRADARYRSPACRTTAWRRRTRQ